MKSLAITKNSTASATAWPSFLRIIPDIDRVLPHTRYLLRPLQGGELVKVLPLAEQIPEGGFSAEAFKARFVRVVRRDDAGRWSDKYTLDWSGVELLAHMKEKV